LGSEGSSDGGSNKGGQQQGTFYHATCLPALFRRCNPKPKP
jgi:hypothetical protein